MADNTSGNETPPAARGLRSELWAVVALAVAGILSITGLALGLVFLMGRNASSPSISNVGNVTLPSPAGGGSAQVEGALRRSAEAPARVSAPALAPQRPLPMDKAQAALPGSLERGNAVTDAAAKAATRREQPVVAATAVPTDIPTAVPTLVPTAVPTVAPAKPEQAATVIPGAAQAAAVPAEPVQADALKVQFRVRGEAPKIYTGKGPLPMPLKPGMDPKSKTEPAAALGAAPAGTTSVTSFAPKAVAGPSWQLSVSSAQKTGTLGGYSAPEGFQFFTADVTVKRVSGVALALDADRFEVRDSDRVPYLPDADLSQGLPSEPLGPGDESTIHLSFSVPSGIEPVELALVTDQGSATVPLAQR